MSGANINVSGSASFTPPSSCSPGQEGHPVYTSEGNQSIYADVPNGTPIRITITASVSGSGGGWATWSDAKSGSGGTSATTVFNALAGPGKITVDGVDYYLIDSIRANGAAVSSRICSANRQSFSASVSLQFEVLGTNLKKIYGDGGGPIGSRLPNPLTVQVLDTATGNFVNGVNINFAPANGGNSCPGFSVSPTSTDTFNHGIARSYVDLPQQTGNCIYKATCASCLGNRTATFAVEATPTPELNVSGDGSGGGGRGSGGGPSDAGGARGGGGKGPLQIEYTINGLPLRLIDSSEAFVGVLVNDEVHYQARPPSGSFNWLGTATSGSGFEATARYTAVTTPSAPARETITRVSDGRSATANVIVQRFPGGPGEEVERKLVARELCGGPTLMRGIRRCETFKIVHSQAYQWAFETFGSEYCHNNCCDAGKHTYWHAVITGLIGNAYSVRLGDAHEVTNIAAGASHSDVAMDMFNNDLGRSLGSGQSDEGLIASRVLQAIRGGQALVLQNPKTSTDPLSLMLRSNKCAR